MGCKCTLESKDIDDLVLQKQKITSNSTFQSKIDSIDKKEYICRFDSFENEINDDILDKKHQVFDYEEKRKDNDISKSKKLQNKIKFTNASESKSSRDSFEHIDLNNPLNTKNNNMVSSIDDQKYYIKSAESTDGTSSTEKESNDNIQFLNENILKFINEARTMPYEFCNHIIDNINYIKYEPQSSQMGDYVFVKDDKNKVNLMTGKNAFIQAAQTLALKDPMAPLEIRNDLIIKIPNDKEKMFNKTYIQDILAKKFNNSNYKLFGFHFDLGIDALSSVVLQIVDDNANKSQRRNNILNPDYKYIGISSKKIGSVYCIYIAFSS
jgi:hypothetical protein